MVEVKMISAGMVWCFTVSRVNLVCLVVTA